MDPESISDLLSEDRLRIKALYNRYRMEFFGFGKRYNLSNSELSDIYQEAFIALRKHGKSGKLNSVNSSMKTYLFGICKNMIYDLFRYRKQTIPYEAELHKAGEEIEEIKLAPAEALSVEQRLLRKFFQKLGKTCQEVLTLFYYRGLSLEEIVSQTDHANTNVVKATKSRCLKTLRDKIKIQGYGL